MDTVFDTGDALGPARVIHVQQAHLGLRGILVVDNVAAGPAIGGLRMATDVTLQECQRLARAMTLKNAAAGLAHGGGKSVLIADPHQAPEKKEQLIRAFACALKHESDYIFGPDMGTDETCMAWVKDEIGRAVGLPSELGGIPLDQIGATGWGVFHATDVALPYLNIALSACRVAIQGFGAVGQHAAHYLCDAGATLVAVSDTGGTLYDPDGLDFSALRALKRQGHSVADYHKGKKLAADAIIGVECDVWIPAARPDVVNGSNVAQMNTRLVVQGANIPFTHDAELALFNQGVLVVPDFIANAGGVICAAVEYRHLSQQVAFGTIEEKVRDNTAEVLSNARRQNIPPRRAAEVMARSRVESAMAMRRWGGF